MESKDRERGWLKHQSSGEFDDSKLVDGITGERNVFKRRGIEDNPALHERRKKRMLFVLDVSASMYRFNGLDISFSHFL
jgi:hypothetical protein